VNAVFGGEHSAHFYFRDFYYADSGMLAAMHVLAALGESDAPLSALLGTHDPYPASGEINSRVDSVSGALERVREAFSGEGVEVDEFDGLTFTHWGSDDERWWFNVRGSNTEPLLRLNVEAAERDVMERVRDRALGVIREG
jgi:phosphomannomutase